MPLASFHACLLGPAPSGFFQGSAQTVGHDVGVEDDATVHVARRPADGLGQAGLAAQEALLVRVQDRHQRAFGDVQPLAQQVDADQHVEHAQAQVADDLDPLQRVHVRVEVPDFDRRAR